ncbi:MAG TPA: patatin-like phospholipase family protein [Gemmatimonadales bacterium]|nr:patatin-like phospholipase family protein [Gemmatimonadales bacterium]
MRNVFILLLSLLLLSAPAAHPAFAQQCQAPRTALVLSGGGAKGLTHIGLLRSLDSLGIRPDLIVGTSMGAVVGAMYASGYPARTIDSLARAFPIATLFTTFEPRAPRALGRLQPLIVWEQGDRGFNLQSAAVRETEANALLDAAMLRGNLIARGDFDRLPIPLRVVATDLGTHKAVVLGTGDLAQAVRASIAIPFVFPPERLHGRFLADGGLSANLPIAIARAAGAERLIVADATERKPDSLNFFSPVTLAERMLGYLFEQPVDSLGPDDIYIRPNVAGYRSLNFTPRNVNALIIRGRLAADSMLPRLKCPPRGDVPGRAEPTTLGGIAVRDSSLKAAREMGRLLGLADADSLNPDRLRSRLLKLGNSDRFLALWLHPRGEGDTVRFNVQPEPGPVRIAALGAAYDNDMGGRVWAGAVDRSLPGGTEASILGTAGNLRKDATLALQKQRDLFGQLVVPRAAIRMRFDHIRRFDDEGEQVGVDRTRELEALLGVQRSFFRTWLAQVSGSALWWRNPDQTTEDALGVRFELSHVDQNLDEDLAVRALWNQEFRRVELDLKPVFPIGLLEVNPHVRLGVGRDLPLQSSLALGGDDGFAGLHIGELRGDREVLAGLALAFPIAGPLHVRVDGMVGRVAVGGGLLDEGGWHTGIRSGVGADTPVGPVRVEMGFTGGREALFVRLGRWF